MLNWLQYGEFNKKIFTHFGTFFLFVALYLAFFPYVLTGQIFGGADGVEVVLPSFFAPLKLWSNDVYGGIPIMAEPHSFMWNPVFQLLRFFLSPENAYNWFHILTYSLYSTFCFGLVYSLTGRWIAGFTSGVLIATSGFVMAHFSHVHLIHPGAWLPLVFWGVEEIRKRKFRLGIIMVAMAYGIAGSGCHPQLFSYMPYFGFLYILARMIGVVDGKLKYFFSSLFAMGIGFLLAAIQLIPTLEFSLFATRGHPDFEFFTSWFLPIRAIVDLFFPYFHGPIYQFDIPLFNIRSDHESMSFVSSFSIFFAFIAIFSENKDLRRLCLIFLGIAVLAIMLTLGAATPVAKWFFHLPLYGSFRVISRHLFLWDLSLAIMGGLGLSVLFSSSFEWSRIRKAGVAFGVLLLAVIYVLVANFSSIKGLAIERFDISKTHWFTLSFGHVVFIICVTVFALLIAKLKQRRVLVIVLLLALYGDSFFHRLAVWPFPQRIFTNKGYAQQDEAVKKYKPLLMSSHHRYMPGDPNSYLFAPNFSRIYEIPSGSGHMALVLSNYSELMRTGPQGIPDKEIFTSSHHELDIYSFRFVSFSRPPGKTIDDVINDNPFLRDKDRWKFSSEELVYKNPSPIEPLRYLVFENLRVYPRVRIANKNIFVPIEGLGDTVRIIQNKDEDQIFPYEKYDPKKYTIVDPKDIEELKELSEGEGEAGIVELEDHDITINVNAKKASLLILSDNFYPGWQAFVGDKEVKIYRVNATMRAVPVPAGPSVVKFEFRPKSFYLGAALSAFAVLILLAIGIFPIFKRKNRT